MKIERKAIKYKFQPIPHEEEEEVDEHTNIRCEKEYHGDNKNS